LNNTRKKGYNKESACIEFLKNKNYKILKRNYFTRYGEIDIICYKNQTIYFIEVKSGNYSYESLLLKLTPKKQNKMIKAALDFYTKIDSSNTQISFMYMIVYRKKISYYEDIITFDLNHNTYETF
jgi:putative endonuclease